MGRTIDEFLRQADEDAGTAEIADYVRRVSLGREIVFNVLKQAITEFDFEIRVVSDSQFEIEFFGPNAPPLMFVTVDAPIPPGAFHDS